MDDESMSEHGDGKMEEEPAYLFRLLPYSQFIFPANSHVVSEEREENMASRGAFSLSGP